MIKYYTVRSVEERVVIDLHHGNLTYKLAAIVTEISDQLGLSEEYRKAAVI